jgi:hypothetical protein
MGGSHGQQNVTCSKTLNEVLWHMRFLFVMILTGDSILSSYQYPVLLAFIAFNGRCWSPFILYPTMSGVKAKDVHKLFKQALISRRYMTEDLAALLWKKCEEACRSN